MKKISAKQVMTYVLLAGLLLLLVVYFLICKKFDSKTEAIEASNTTLSARVAELKKYYDELETYKTDMEQMNGQISAWLSEFPADVKEEDIIVLALDTEKNALVGYTNINIQNREELKTIPADTVKAAGMENLTQDIIFVQRKTGYVNVTDYINLKSCIRTINDNDNRLNISNVSYSKNDETGELEGTIEVTFYSVLGTGKEYVPQKLPEYESGLYNLFGTVDVSEEE